MSAFVANNFRLEISTGHSSQLDAFVSSCRSVMRPGIKSLILSNNFWDPENQMSSLIEELLTHFSPTLEFLTLALVLLSLATPSKQFDLPIVENPQRFQHFGIILDGSRYWTTQPILSQLISSGVPSQP